MEPQRHRGPSAAFGRNQIKSISCLSSFSWSPSVNSMREEPRKKRKTRKHTEEKFIHRLRRFPQMKLIPRPFQSAKICAICGSTRSSTNILLSRSYASAPTKFFARRANLNCLYYREPKSEICARAPLPRRLIFLEVRNRYHLVVGAARAGCFVCFVVILHRAVSKGLTTKHTKYTKKRRVISRCNGKSSRGGQI
jgi:hypothetical protein